MIRLLLTMSAKLQAPNSRNLNPLHMAANYGNGAAADVLIDSGADIEARSSKGYTLLHLATAWIQRSTARLLLERGADIRAPSYSKESVMTTAISGYKCEDISFWERPSLRYGRLD